MLAKIIEFVKQSKTYWYEGFLVLCIALIAFTSYNLGKVRSLEKVPLEIGEADIYKAVTGDFSPSTGTAASQGPQTSKAPVKPRDPRVVVSKNSTSKVYHHTWCSSASRIKEENKVWFETAAIAQAAGYTLAGNCQ